MKIAQMIVADTILVVRATVVTTVGIVMEVKEAGRTARHEQQHEPQHTRNRILASAFDSLCICFALGGATASLVEFVRPPFHREVQFFHIKNTEREPSLSSSARYAPA